MLHKARHRPKEDCNSVRWQCYLSGLANVCVASQTSVALHACLRADELSVSSILSLATRGSNLC